MKILNVNDYEARALSTDSPDCWQWHCRNWLRMRALDIADHFVDVVEVRCGNRKVCKVESHHLGKGPPVMHHNNTLPEERVREIRERLLTAESDAQVALETGISRTTVRNIRIGARYVGIGMVGEVA